jgi:hypothetical protein
MLSRCLDNEFKNTAVYCVGMLSVSQCGAALAAAAPAAASAKQSHLLSVNLVCSPQNAFHAVSAAAVSAVAHGCCCEQYQLPAGSFCRSLTYLPRRSAPRSCPAPAPHRHLFIAHKVQVGRFTERLPVAAEFQCYTSDKALMAAGCKTQCVTSCRSKHPCLISTL